MRFDNEHSPAWRSSSGISDMLLFAAGSATWRPVREAQGGTTCRRAVVRSPKKTPLQTIMKASSAASASVLIIHTGGTLGMDPSRSFGDASPAPALVEGTGGTYPLQPGDYLTSVLDEVPELHSFGDIELEVLFNKDSSRVAPGEWTALAKRLHERRNSYDSFVVIHGTDTMAYTASALSLMLVGFNKAIVLTGSQRPLSYCRTDARQNLVNSVAVASSGKLSEVAICFGGVLLRGNRAQKTDSTSYAAFSSPTYPPLANLGVEIGWRDSALLDTDGAAYEPRLRLESNVLRVPCIPGMNPMISYGDLSSRGIKGVVIEAFGVGNLPDEESCGWVPWMAEQSAAGVVIFLGSQCVTGPLDPTLYRSGSAALKSGAHSTGQMTVESALCKLMLHLSNPAVPLDRAIAGEM